MASVDTHCCAYPLRAMYLNKFDYYVFIYACIALL